MQDGSDTNLAKNDFWINLNIAGTDAGRPAGWPVSVARPHALHWQKSEIYDLTTDR